MHGSFYPQTFLVPLAQPAECFGARRFRNCALSWRDVMTRFALLLGLTFSVLAIAPAVAADKFECPSPFKPNTPAKLEQIKGLLSGANAMSDLNQLSATIATLRREGMPKRVIIDHLIGAYCPTMARETSLTGAEKAARVARFSGQVTRLVYSLESGLDIIINVPLTPDIVDAVNTIAKKQGLSGPAWIAMTIDDALEQQRAARRQ
jgi:hypothetical protein